MDGVDVAGAETMRLRLKHLLWANAFVAAYLSLCRAGAWALSYVDADGVMRFVGVIVLLGTVMALCNLQGYACERMFGDPMKKGDFETFGTLIAIGLIAATSILGTRAWFYGGLTP
jgi:hypothetical protein